MFTLRNTQEEAIFAVQEAWKKDKNDVLIVMATGTGKTAVFLSLLERILRHSAKRALIVAHRQELIYQPRDRMLEYYGQDWTDRIGIVMGTQNQSDRQITIATVQTINSSRRIKEILKAGKIDYLVIDEAHHAVARSYLKAYEHLKAENPDLKHLGVTATPMRADERGLAEIYGDCVYRFGIKEAIRARQLVNVRWLGIKTKISIKDVKSLAGDFNLKDLSKAFETEKMIRTVLAAYKAYAPDRQAIAFTASVDGAYRMADTFNAAGIPAVAASAETKNEERASILNDFYAGKVKVLCNMGLYTEGLDLPMASCILQARPTKSDTLYVQMIGRALRVYPDKEDALILDFVPKEKRNMIMAGDVLGLSRPVIEAIESTIDEHEKDEAEEELDLLSGFTFDGAFNLLDGSPADLIARQLDYLDNSPWSWYRDRNNILSVGLGEAKAFDNANISDDYFERTLVIAPPAEGENSRLFLVWRKVSDPRAETKERGQWKSTLIKTAPYTELEDFANDLANRYGNSSLANKRRSWRSAEASKPQLSFLGKLGAQIPEEPLTKGRAAQIITHTIALKQLKYHGFEL